jgi:hypothetical protein
MADGVNTYIHGEARYVVVAPVAVVETVGGGQQYVYKNGYLPVNARPANIGHLLEHGYIVEVGDSE